MTITVHVTIDDSRLTETGRQNALVTPTGLSSYIEASVRGSVGIDGTNYSVTTVATAGLTSQGDTPQDRMSVINILTNKPGAGPYAVGNAATMQTTSDNSHGAHEVTHGFGADDQYRGGRRLDNSVLTEDASPDSNLMRNYAPRVNPQTLREILTRNFPDQNAYRCAPGVSAPGGQC